MIAAPTASTTSAMPRTGARRPVQPPPKSPAPHATAEASPSATTARLDPAGSAVDAPAGRLEHRGRGHRLAVVDLGRAVEGDDRVRGPVVPVRGRQVDHLE